jgi:hypothetical protein
MSVLIRPEPFSTEFNRLFNSLWDASPRGWVPEMDPVRPATIEGTSTES